MKLLFVFAALIAVGLAASDEELWTEFKRQHGKMYRSRMNEKVRFNIFKNNLRKIEAHNERFQAGLSTYKMGITKFADMTSKEFSEMLTLQGKPMLKYAEHYIPSGEAPKAIDWRELGAVTEIKDQGSSCGACWSFSAAGALEGQYCQKNQTMISFSTQYLIDCANSAYGNHGCVGGRMDNAFDYLKTHGLPSEENYPYKGENGECRESVEKVLDKISGYKTLTNEEHLLNAVGTVGPVSVAVNATSWQFYYGGIYKDAFCNPRGLNHAVLVVGYGSANGQDYWIIKNSWGEFFGENGYVRLARGTNECGVADACFVPQL